jgi:hypothetical protein
LSLSKPIQLLGLTALSFLLTAGSFVLGAVPMRWMERRFGGFWTFVCHVALLSLLLYYNQIEFALVIFGLLVLVLSFSFFERELAGKSKFWLGALSVAFSAGLSALMLGAWGVLEGRGQLEAFFASTQERWVQVTEVVGQSGSSLSTDHILRLMPGVLLSCWIAALMLAVMFDLPRSATAAKVKAFTVFNFRIPDVFVLITIAAIFGAFYQYEGFETLRFLSENVLLVCGFLYMVQGMTVVLTFVRFWRIPVFFRVVLFVMLFINFFIIALVGFSDYWLEYRRRFLLKGREN